MNSLLVISPVEEDHVALGRIFRDTDWTVHYAYTCEEAAECLEEHSVSVIICERDLPACSWRDVLRRLERMPEAPVLIVAYRLADEPLWADVVHLGGYDLLLTPFNRGEVLWAVNNAVRKWTRQHLFPDCESRTDEEIELFCCGGAPGYTH